MPTVQPINRQLFPTEVLDSDIPVVVELRGNQCRPCQKLEPIVDRLADEFQGRIKFVKINTDEEPALAGFFDATDLPTLALVHNSRDEGFFLGEMEEPEIRGHLRKWLEQEMSKTPDQQ